MAHQQSFSQDARLPGLPIGEQRMSRRTILRNLIGFTLAGGSIISFATSCNSPTNPSLASRAPASPTPTPSTLKTLLYTYRGHLQPVRSVAWSPGATRLASGGYSGMVQVWDAANGGHVYTYHGHSDHVGAVAWSPDCRHIVSGSDDRTVQVWNAANGGHVYIYRGHSDAVLGVAWSPDGGRIVSAGGNIDNGRGDTSAQVWDAANGGHASIYRGHSNLIWAVAWSPDGIRIASGSVDKTVQVWRAR
jgi:WD40 repeat protein